jgi:hypothetical protein
MLNEDWDSPIARTYLSDQMRLMLSSALRRNGKAISDETTSQIQQRLDSHDEPTAEKGSTQ